MSVNELEAFDLVALGRALASTRVRTLALRDNRLAGGLANLNRLKLTALHLDVNRLTSIKALGLRQLRELSVCDNKLGSSGDGGLSLVASEAASVIVQKEKKLHIQKLTIITIWPFPNRAARLYSQK